MNPMHFRNSRTRFGDHLILLIKTSNAHEEKMLPQTIFLKSVRGEIETQTKIIIAANGGCFHNDRNKLFSDKPILSVGSVPFLSIFLTLNSLAALFALFPA